MTKSELIAGIAETNPHLHFAEVERAIETVFDVIAEALARGDRVEFRGFGAFTVRTRKARIGRNPKTGETVSVNEKQVPLFKAGKSLRLGINGRT